MCWLQGQECGSDQEWGHYHENAKLKKELQEQAKHNTIVIESLDQDKKLAYENKLLKEENQYLKLGLLYDK